MNNKKLELEIGKYYDVTLWRYDVKNKHIKLVEFNYTGDDSVLYFVNDEGHKIIIDYSAILCISESTENVKKYPEALYFKDKMLHLKDKKYCIKIMVQKNFYLVYNNCIIEGINMMEDVPHLRIFTTNDRIKYINMLFIEDIYDSE